jgi:fatty acid desaturase
MFLFGNPEFTSSNIFHIFKIWNLILIIGCFLLSTVGLNVGHHDTKVTHEGDKNDNFDFGIYQVRSVIERTGAKANLFMSLTTFGDHILHHLFPSIDQALLPQLNDILFETCKEFREEIREYSIFDGFVGQFQQLERKELK